MTEEERNKGFKVKVGYMKLNVEENWLSWDEELGSLRRAGKQHAIG